MEGVKEVPIEGEDELELKDPSRAAGTVAQVKKSLPRRSSILNAIRRQSKSIVGIPFEDQVSAIDLSLSVEERLSKLLRISLSATVRLVQAQNAEADSDTKTNDMVEDICSEIRRGSDIFSENQTLTKPLVDKIKKIADDGGANSIPREQMLPARVREIREYRDKLNAEMEAWKALQIGRSDEYKKSRADHIQKAKGKVKITHAERKNLREDEVQILDNLPDGVQMWNRVLKMEKDLELKKKELCHSIQSRKRTLDEKSSQISGFAKRLKTKCDSLHRDEDALAELGKETKLSGEVKTYQKQQQQQQQLIN